MNQNYDWLTSLHRKPYQRPLATRGGTVQLFHGSVCITVLESRFGIFREKLYCQITIKKIRII